MSLEVALICVLGLLLGNQMSADQSLRSITEFDTDLPEDADVEQLVSGPGRHVPFQYNQGFFKKSEVDRPFSYDPRAANGPHNWHKHHPSCNGRDQSPIHVQTKTCSRHFFSTPLRYVHSHKQPHTITVENNGYTLGFSFSYNGTRPYLTGGPLRSTYVFETMHMHWGSEHAIDHRKADLEMHLIHRNVKYDSFEEAMQHPDGLVVVGLLADASSNIEPFNMFKHLNDVRRPLSSVVLTGRPVGYILRNLLGFLPQETLISYKGSLTTPPCTEATLWLLAQRVRKISKNDIDQIRKTLREGGLPMGPNNRPIQKTNNRPCVMFKMNQQY